MAHSELTGGKSDRRPGHETQWNPAHDLAPPWAARPGVQLRYLVPGRGCSQFPLPTLGRLKCPRLVPFATALCTLGCGLLQTFAGPGASFFRAFEFDFGPVSGGREALHAAESGVLRGRVALGNDRSPIGLDITALAVTVPPAGTALVVLGARQPSNRSLLQVVVHAPRPGAAALVRSFSAPISCWLKSGALLRQWRRRRPCVRGGVIDEIARSWRPPAVTPTSRPKPRGVSNAIDGDALRWHGLVRRGSPAETRPARWNLVDARTTSDGGTDGQAYA